MRANYQRAFVAVERALKFTSHNLLFMRFQAEMYYLLGNKKKALEIIDEALRIDPEDLDTHRVKDQFR